MISPDQLDSGERIVQKLEKASQDPDLANFLRPIVADHMKPRVLVGEFTPDQYGRVLRAYNLLNLRTPEDIDQEVAAVEKLVE